VIVLIFIDQFLQGEGVSVCRFDILFVAEGNIFKSMDFTSVPEDVIDILALALDLEDLGEVRLL